MIIGAPGAHSRVRGSELHTQGQAACRRPLFNYQAKNRTGSPA